MDVYGETRTPLPLPDKTESSRANMRQQQFHPAEHWGEGQNPERSQEGRDWMKDGWRKRAGQPEKGSDISEIEQAREKPTERWMQRGRRGEGMV